MSQYIYNPALANDDSKSLYSLHTEIKSVYVSEKGQGVGDGAWSNVFQNITPPPPFPSSITTMSLWIQHPQRLIDIISLGYQPVPTRSGPWGGFIFPRLELELLLHKNFRSVSKCQRLLWQVSVIHCTILDFWVIC